MFEARLGPCGSHIKRVLQSWCARIWFQGVNEQELECTTETRLEYVGCVSWMEWLSSILRPPLFFYSSMMQLYERTVHSLGFLLLSLNSSFWKTDFYFFRFFVSEFLSLIVMYRKSSKLNRTLRQFQSGSSELNRNL